MAEIKSTLDLVMEKTKGLVQSDEEKKAIRNQEREQRARSLLLKLKEGQIRPDNLVGALEELGEKDIAPLRRILIRLLMESISLGADNSAFLGGLKSLSASSGDDGMKKIEALLQEYDRSVVELAHVYRKKLLEELSRQGISGSAVIPKLDQDSDWAEARKGMDIQFEARLNQAKELFIEEYQSS